jgi:hypothetical protein
MVKLVENDPCRKIRMAVSPPGHAPESDDRPERKNYYKPNGWYTIPPFFRSRTLSHAGTSRNIDKEDPSFQG